MLAFYAFVCVCVGVATQWVSAFWGRAPSSDMVSSDCSPVQHRGSPSKREGKGACFLAATDTVLFRASVVLHAAGAPRLLTLACPFGQSTRTSCAIVTPERACCLSGAGHSQQPRSRREATLAHKRPPRPGPESLLRQLKQQSCRVLQASLLASATASTSTKHWSGLRFFTRFSVTFLAEGPASQSPERREELRLALAQAE